MKKLLFINGHLKVGGCERSLTDILKYIDYSIYSVDLLLIEDLGEYVAELPKDVNVIYYDTKKAFGSFFKCIFRAIKQRDWFSIKYRINNLICTRYGPEKIKYIATSFDRVKPFYDAIIAYRPGTCTDLAAFAFSSKTKLTWWHHGEYYNFGCILPSYKKMNNIVAVSKSSAKIVKDHFKSVQSKVTVIPNMICDLELQRKANEVDICVPDKLIIVSVGRFSPEKNMILCPEIAKQLTKINIDYLWYMVGDGQQYGKVKSFTEEYGVSKNFIFTGIQSNPYPFIKKANIMLHPSLVESQGISALEAMALGTPVVAVESLGIKEYIIDGENGFLVQPNAWEIAQLIKNISSDKQLLSKVVSNAKKTIKNYSPQKTINRFYNLLTE